VQSPLLPAPPCRRCNLLKKEKTEGGKQQCREETEQAQRARDQVQGEERAEAQGEAAARVKEAPGRGEEVVSQQALVVIACVQTAVKEQPINWGSRVMNSNAPSAERL